MSTQTGQTLIHDYMEANQNANNSQVTQERNPQAKSPPNWQDAPVSVSNKKRKISNSPESKNGTQGPGTSKIQTNVNKNKSSSQLPLKNRFQNLNEETGDDTDTLNRRNVTTSKNVAPKHPQSEN